METQGERRKKRQRHFRGCPEEKKKPQGGEPWGGVSEWGGGLSDEDDTKVLASCVEVDELRLYLQPKK